MRRKLPLGCGGLIRVTTSSLDSHFLGPLNHGFLCDLLASWVHAYVKEGKQVLQCFFLLSLPYKRVWLSKKPVGRRFFWRRVAQDVVQIEGALSYGVVLFTPPSLNPITLAQ